MTPVTLTTLLNTAPVILQAATKLVKTLREREKGEGGLDHLPDTVEGLKGEIRKLDARVNENYRSDAEQVRLIEELAKQNEALAETLRQALRRLTVLTYLAAAALAVSAGAIIWQAFGS